MVVKFLVVLHHCGDDYGTLNIATHLRLACQFGHLDLVIYLTRTCMIDLRLLPSSFADELVKTTLQRGSHDTIYFLLSNGLKLSVNNQVYGYSDLLHPAMKVFILGNPLTGKSTLIKAILILKVKKVNC